MNTHIHVNTKKLFDGSAFSIDSVTRCHRKEGSEKGVWLSVITTRPGAPMGLAPPGPPSPSASPYS